MEWDNREFRMKLFSILLFLAAFVIDARPLFAQPGFSRETHIALLDEAAREPRRVKLAELVFNPQNDDEALANLDWLGAKFIGGDSAFFAFAYSRTLIDAARSLPTAQADSLNGTAFAAMIYAVAASYVDGLQCADITARNNRAGQFASHLQELGFSKLDKPTRLKASYIAAAVEQRSWIARRVTDDTAFQCLNGMDAMFAGLESGQAAERAPKQGEIGKQVEVSIPTGFVFKRRGDAEWWADAEKIRSKLPELIAQLATVDRIPTGSELDALQKDE
jgi:hypothetical protein